MTTVEIELPDELARQAKEAGLLAPEKLESLLRDQLRKRAGEALHEIWERMPAEEVTPEIEQEIVTAVRAARREPSAP